MSMNENQIASVLKRGIAGFKARRVEHEDELLARIFEEVDFVREISDDELELLSAAGDVDAMLRETEGQ